MTEIDVALTDYFLALICAYFYGQVSRSTYATPALRWLWQIFFLSILVASAVGGTVHGFFLDKTSVGNRILWPFTLLSVGCTTYSLWMITAHLWCSSRWITYWRVFAISEFYLFTIVVLFISKHFGVVLLNYLPALFFFLGVACLRWWHHRSAADAWAVAAVLVSLAAAGVQALHWSLHPIYFTHNSVYHLIQALGLYYFYRAACSQRSFVNAQA